MAEYPELATVETKALMVRAFEEISSRQEFFDADIDIYGEFEDLAIQFRRLRRGEWSDT